MELPKYLKPVLAEIQHQNSLGSSKWFEVVYYDDDIDNKWCCYAGSDTFKDGHQVLRWKYADECL